MTWSDTHPDLFKHADPRVFVTEADHPGDGRAFVYAVARWYEREVGDTGAVAFSPVADDEETLRAWLRESGLEIDELDSGHEFARLVRSEFMEQVPLYPEASSELSGLE